VDRNEKNIRDVAPGYLADCDGALAFVHVSFANTGLGFCRTGPRGGYLPVARSVVGPIIEAPRETGSLLLPTGCGGGCRESLSGFPERPGMKTQGEIEATFCDCIRRFENRIHGPGPKDVHVHMIGDLILVSPYRPVDGRRTASGKSLPAGKGRD